MYRSATSNSGRAALGRLFLALGSAWILVGASAGLGALDPRIGVGLALFLLICHVIMEARGSQGDFFAPGVFVLAYVALVMLAPWLFMSVTGQPIQSISPDTVNGPVIKVMIATVCGWGAGAAFGAAILRRSPSAGDDESMVSSSSTDEELSLRLRVWAGMFLLFTGALRAFLVYESAGRAYGANQFEYTVASAITPAADASLTISVALYVAAALRSDRRIFTPGIAALVLLTCGLSMFALGSRGELIAPVLVYLWGQFKLGKIRVPHLALVGAAGLAAFFAVAKLRANETSSFLVRTLADISSPYLVTDWIMQYVPTEAAYLMGETYLATVTMLPPGPISRFFVGDLQTASFRFRQIVGYDNPDQGYSFALPAEAYLNFGFAGALLIPMFVGLAFSWVYFRFGSGAMGFMSVLYPMLVGALPYALRSDSLAQIKTTVFPMVLIGLLVWYESEPARRLAARVVAARPDRRAGWLRENASKCQASLYEKGVL